MRKHLTELAACAIAIVLCGVILTPSRTLASIIQAIIPQAVPTPNKRGTATVFQLATNTSAAVAGTPFCDDGSGNTTTSGCTGGGTVPAGSSIFNATSSATATAASATSLIGGGAATIPANTLITQDPLSTFFGGIYTIPGAYTGTLTIQLLIAGSPVASSGAITLPAAAVTNGAWRLSCQITVRTTGVSGTAIYSCPLEMIGSSLTSLTPAEASLANTATFSINTTISNTIDVQATWSTTLGSPSITGQYATGFIGGAPVTSVNGNTGAITGLLSVSGFYLTDGASNYYIGPTFQKATLPVAGNFSWVNQGGASETASGNALVLSAPSGAGDSLRMRVFNIGANTKFTANVSCTLQTENFQGCGVLFYESATGKVETIGGQAFNTGNANVPGAVANQTGLFTNIIRWTNTTTFSADQYSQVYGPWITQWVQIEFSSNTLFFRVSSDGVNFNTLYSEAKGSFFTTAPNQWGYFADSNNSVSNTPAVATLFSAATQ